MVVLWMKKNANSSILMLLYEPAGQIWFETNLKSPDLDTKYDVTVKKIEKKNVADTVVRKICCY